MTNFNYQVSGSLPADAPSYVERQGDREYYQLLKELKYCYVFNCRQMGSWRMIAVRSDQSCG